MDAQGRASSQSRVVRILTDAGFRRRLVRLALGKPVPMDTDDRRVLEQLIFPYYDAQPDIHTVLFVGVGWYTRHYGESFFPRKNFWTLDSSRHARRYGARQHVECLLEDAGMKFPAGYFDLVLLNGVYGHGLNEWSACERAFEACYVLLRDGGHFLLGWNDVPQYRGAPLETIRSLTRFTPVSMPPLDAHFYLTDSADRHIYQFYRKLAASITPAEAQPSR